jgi:hypothetical protein
VILLRVFGSKEQGDGLPVRQRRQTHSLVSMLRQLFPIGLLKAAKSMVSL